MTDETYFPFDTTNQRDLDASIQKITVLVDFEEFVTAYLSRKPDTEEITQAERDALRSVFPEVIQEVQNAFIDNVLEEVGWQLDNHFEDEIGEMLQKQDADALPI